MINFCGIIPLKKILTLLYRDQPPFSVFIFSINGGLVKGTVSQDIGPFFCLNNSANYSFLQRNLIVCLHRHTSFFLHMLYASIHICKLLLLEMCKHIQRIFFPNCSFKKKKSPSNNFKHLNLYAHNNGLAHKSRVNFNKKK